MNSSHDVTVFTAIAGTKDVLHEDFDCPDGARFVAYLDEEAIRGARMKMDHHGRFGPWELRELPCVFGDPIRNARMVKILSHIYADTTCSIWLDGNITFQPAPIAIAKWFIPDTGYLAGAFTHFKRTTPSEEATECSLCEKDDNHVLFGQISSLERRGRLRNIVDAGFYETGVLVRHRCDMTIARNNDWFAEMAHGSRRDQITFPVAFRGFVNGVMGNVRTNKSFTYHNHD